jgi:hypothetical protein
MKRIKLIFGIVGVITLMAVNFSITKSDIDSDSTIDLKRLITLPSALGGGEHPDDLWIEDMIHSNGSCFACWPDPFGGLEMICPADYYEIFCIEDPAGSPNCTESKELFCYENDYSCYTTYRDC